MNETPEIDQTLKECSALADIREIIGDPTGKLMLNEVVKKIKGMQVSINRSQGKLDLLQKMQSKMRDPERKLVCDIIANGQLLPSDGKRYGFVTTGKEHYKTCDKPATKIDQ